MKVRIIEYFKNKNECRCWGDDGHSRRIDPFVACLIMTDEEYHDGKGYSLEGKLYEIPDDVFINDEGTILPSEGEMVEVST